MSQSPKMAAHTEALSAQLKAEGSLKLTREEAWKQNLCVKCGQPPTFSTRAGVAEYQISGFCEPCFDAQFPDDDMGEG